MADSGDFSMGNEVKGGAFQRQRSAFRDRVSDEGSTEFPVEAGRYALYVSWACPWAHRTIIARELLGLEDALPMGVVDSWRDERGWGFTPGEFDDPIEHMRWLSEAYHQTDPSFSGRVTVPVLWDTRTRRIVANESSDVLRMLTSVFRPLGTNPDLELYPTELQGEVDRLADLIYEPVNNGVYKAGFATSQEVYEHEVRDLFAVLDELDALLATRRWLAGDQLTEADIRLYTTLVRFDSVYAIHFKCAIRRIVDYRNLWPYLRDLYATPGFGSTTRMDEIKRHYYTTHRMVNPHAIVPVGPEIEFTAAHDRARLAPAAAVS